MDVLSCSLKELEDAENEILGELSVLENQALEHLRGATALADTNGDRSGDVNLFRLGSLDRADSPVVDSFSVASGSFGTQSLGRLDSGVSRAISLGETQETGTNRNANRAASMTFSSGRSSIGLGDNFYRIESFGNRLKTIANESDCVLNKLKCAVSIVECASVLYQSASKLLSLWDTSKSMELLFEQVGRYVEQVELAKKNGYWNEALIVITKGHIGQVIASLKWAVLRYLRVADRPKMLTRLAVCLGSETEVFKCYLSAIRAEFPQTTSASNAAGIGSGSGTSGLTKMTAGSEVKTLKSALKRARNALIYQANVVLSELGGGYYIQICREIHEHVSVEVAAMFVEFVKLHFTAVLPSGAAAGGAVDSGDNAIGTSGIDNVTLYSTSGAYGGTVNTQGCVTNAHGAAAAHSNIATSSTSYHGGMGATTNNHPNSPNSASNSFNSAPNSFNSAPNSFNSASNGAVKTALTTSAAATAQVAATTSYNASGVSNRAGSFHGVTSGSTSSNSASYSTNGPTSSANEAHLATNTALNHRDNATSSHNSLESEALLSRLKRALEDANVVETVVADSKYQTVLDTIAMMASLWSDFESALRDSTRPPLAHPPLTNNTYGTDGLVTLSLATKTLQSLLSAYVQLQHVFILKYVKQAIQVDAIYQSVSTLVDDVFFILQKSQQRSIGTGDLQTACATFNQTSAIIGGELKTALVGNLVESRSLYERWAQKLDNLSSSSVQTMLEDHLKKTRGSIPDSIGSKHSFVHSLNNVEECLGLLEKFKQEMSESFADRFFKEKQQQNLLIDNTIQTLDSVASELEEILNTCCEYVFNILKDHLNDPLLKFGAVDFEMDDEKYSRSQNDESFADQLVSVLNVILGHLDTNYTPKVALKCMTNLVEKLSKYLETATLSKRFTIYGAVYFDTAIRSLVYACSSYNQEIRRQFTALLQISDVLNVNNRDDLMLLKGIPGYSYRLS
ncbi:uncharacterized protein TOT_010000568 [Theileria orientalis strain Shintoku]|uniref:Uncharacterized protein n=1 Tax=Theileria orientalis strain Shintoku TaxID=869250 RepID=J4C2Q6_THEOR|nr:uncharacterized protein TOT_010000568 [Theileria orientalis strain Shintoku]BAM39106.1 uncharacterized protein TOT_010000568 [Theileria orientalis strain Shintoku]|eukprot:XP_009689407.1 uncharacterized protein TOT_010000568 [Theileria orientalis strain Shintoku]